MKVVAALLLALALAGCTQVCNGKRVTCYDNCGYCPDGSKGER